MKAIINLQDKRQNSSPRTPVVEEYAANLPRTGLDYSSLRGHWESNPCPVREFPTLAAAEQLYHRSGGDEQFDSTKNIKGTTVLVQ